MANQGQTSTSYKHSTFYDLLSLPEEPAIQWTHKITEMTLTKAGVRPLSRQTTGTLLCFEGLENLAEAGIISITDIGC